jgi:hypothetical protein
MGVPERPAGSGRIRIAGTVDSMDAVVEPTGRYLLRVAAVRMRPDRHHKLVAGGRPAGVTAACALP